MAVPYTFGTATAAIPLSNLDSNFATTITLGNTAIQLGNTVTTLNNMTLANVVVTSVSTAFPNNLLANSSVTLGNTTVALGSTATTLGNVTLAAANITSSLTLTGAAGTSGQVLTSAGAGAAPTWTTPSATVGLSYVFLNTANGYGSTNTKIRRFTNVVNNVGSDITYADSATLGATFTINTNGIYSASYNDQFNTTNNLGLSINSTQLTTSIDAITVSNILSVVLTPLANQPAVASATFYAAASTVIRAHAQGGATGSQPNLCQFTIARVL